MGRFPYLKKFRTYSEADHHFVEVILKKFELIKLADTYFSKLSGGEKQRTIIARALSQKTKTILLDEAFSHLDINHQIDILQLLTEINSREKSIILVSHNLNLVSEYCKRIVVVKNGILVADGNPKFVLKETLLNSVYNTKLTVIDNPISHNPNIVFPKR